MDILYHFQEGGPGKVIKNLKLGLDRLGIEYRENSPETTPDSKVIALQYSRLVNNYKSENIVIGPNTCVLPDEIPFMMECNYLKAIVPCRWVLDVWKNYIPEDKIYIWPVGIDTDLFNDYSNEEKSIDCLIYFKHRDLKELENVKSFLNSRKQSYEVISYNKRYTEAHFLNTLKKSRYGIVIDNTESQGIGLMEIMSTNLPILVWDVTFGVWKGKSYKGTSVPYWNDCLGIRVFNYEELIYRFEEFKENKYEPRKYIVDNFGLEKKAREIIELFKN